MSEWYRKTSKKPCKPSTGNIVGTRTIPTDKDLYPLWPYTVERDSRGKKQLILHKGPKPGSADWHKDAYAHDKQQREHAHRKHARENSEARERQAALDILEGRVKVETAGGDGTWYPEQTAPPNLYQSQGHHGPGVRTAEPVDPWTGAPMDYMPGSSSRPGSRVYSTLRPGSGIDIYGGGMPRPGSRMHHHPSGMPHRVSGGRPRMSGVPSYAPEVPGPFHPPNQ